MLLFVLMRPEIKRDPRLRENAFRQPIDVRVKSLSINCTGFEKAINYENEACTKYHSLVNERNDLLHGNLAIDKLKFNEILFHGKIPIFKEYRSMWQRSLGVDLEAVGFKRIDIEVQIVKNFVNYLLSCLQDQVRIEVGAMLERRDLGLNIKTGGLGILFSDYLVDMVTEFKNQD